MGMTFLRACDAVGFPVSDEFLPGDVDASLSGDLPPGQDPRIYVHHKAASQALDQEMQPPTIIVESDEPTSKVSSNAATK